MPSDINVSLTSTPPLKINVPQTGSIRLKSIGGSDIEAVKIYGDQTIEGNKTFTGITAGITKAMVGLSNVDNTSDINKPVSNATQLVLNGKVDKVVGKVLSDQNYTLAEKDKLAAVVPSKLINGVNEVELGEDANLYLAQNGGLVFDRNNTSINVGMGFHIRSGEGIAIEPIDQYDSQNLITRGWYFSPDGSLTAPNNDYYYARAYIVLNTFPAQDSGFGLTTPDGVTHDFYYDYDGITGPGTPILINPSTDTIIDAANKTITVLNASGLFGDIRWDTDLNYIWVYQNVAGETGNQTNYNYGNDGISSFTGGEASRIIFGDGTIQTTAPTSDAYLLDRTYHTGTQSYTTITGLGTLATQDGTFSDTVNIGETQTITGAKEFTLSPIVPRPTESDHAVNKAYADDISAGLHVHAQVHVILTIDLATATSGTVAYTNGTDGVGAKLTVTGGSTIITALNAECGEDDDLVAGENGSRIIINGEVDNKNWNGIYIITADRELTRAADFDSSIEMAGGDFVFVTHGTTHADTGWVLSEPVTTVGSSNVEFVQFSGSGSYDAGDGLDRDGTIFSVVGTTGRIIVGPSVDLASHGTAGTYQSVTTDAYGRVTSGTNPTTLSGYGITDAAALSGAIFSGNISSANLSGTNSGDQTITLTGDVTGSGTGSFATTLKSVGTAGTYRSVTTDSNGRVTSGTNPTTLGGYGITDAAALSGATFTGPIAATAETGNTISGSSLSGIGVYGSSEVIGLSGQSVDGFGGTFGSINNTALLASTNIGTGIVALSVDGTGIDASSINGVGLKIASTQSIPLVATLNNSAGTIAQFYSGSNKVCSILASGRIQLAANSTGSRTLTLVAPTSSTFNRTITFPSASGTVALAATTLAGYGITDAVSSISLSDHISDETKHLTSAQNTLIDAITVTSTEINHLTDVTSNVQSQINSKSSTAHTHDNATTSFDGFMSAGDKTKLNGISGTNSGDQTITLTGDVTGSGTGSFATTLKSVGTAGTYRSVTTDANGRVTAGTNPTTLAGYGITDVPLDSKQYARKNQGWEEITSAPDDSNTIIGLSLFL